MDTETLTPWNRAGIAARWCRDQFASFFATFWLYIILWGVVAGAFSVLLYIDGIFSRHLAPESINPLSFQAMGWTYRFFAASFLMAAARCQVKDVDGKWTFRWLGVFASLIVCMHAWGFGLEALSDRRDSAMAVREVVEIAETNNTALIATLESRKGQIDADLDKAVTALNAEISQYITDGLNNDHLADDSRARRNALQDQAVADKRAIDDQIMQMVVSGAQERTQAVEVTADAQAWAPLFVGMAQLATLSKEPSDWVIYLCAVGFIVLWVLLAESLVIFLPERIYRMHLNDAASARDGRKDPVRVEAGKKGAKTKARRNRQTNKITEQAESYMPRWKKAVRLAETTTFTAKGIAENAFKEGDMEHAITIMRRAGLITDEDIRKVKRMDEGLPAIRDPNAVDVIHPDTTNGTGQLPEKGEGHVDDNTERAAAD